MCGRFALGVYIPDLEERYHATADEGLDWSPHYNIPPKSDLLIPIITNENKTKHVRAALWGLLPSFVADKKFRLKYSTFNAKCETISTSRSFKPSFEKNMFCLVPMNGFYEWIRRTEPSQPIYIHSKHDKIVSALGLYSIWHGKDKETLLSFSILTTEPNSFMKSIHNRMPILVSKELEEDLLDPSIEPESKLKRSLKGISSDLFNGYPVKRQHVSFRERSDKCIEPDSKTLKEIISVKKA